ncbi:MAG: glycerophosphodiester phosphodiesterase [Vicinamibacterales bacterium]
MRPLVYAHRGGAGLAPENTMAAFDAGLAAGADGIELDVRLSLDSVAVVIHDATVDRTTGASGPVDARTAVDLAGLDAGHRFVHDGTYPFRGRGIGVPSLRAVLDRHCGTSIIIELKSPDPRLAKAVIDDIRAAGAVTRATVGSFQKGALDAVRAIDPAIRTGADMDDVRNGLAAAPGGGRQVRPGFAAFQVPEVYAGTRVVTPDFIARAHEAGVTVMVWTVNQADDMKRLLDWGVDGLITDRPDLAVPIVREWHAGRK